MKSALVRIAVGVVLTGGLSTSAAVAEDGVKALPTLLIKGEVVSLDATDPAATLLKVKDRYGFETPIFLTPETKIMQGETAVQASNLTSGAAVEVEYNFDVNTAKRHAVSVTLASPAQAEAAPAAPAVPAVAPDAAPAAEPEAAPAAPAPDASPEAAPQTQQPTPAQ